MLKFNSIEYNKTDFDIYDSSKKNNNKLVPYVSL